MKYSATSRISVSKTFSLKPMAEASSHENAVISNNNTGFQILDAFLTLSA